MWKQVVAGFVASAVYLLDGINEGFSSTLLHQEDIHAFSFKIDDNDLSWIASAMIITMPIGSLCSGPMMRLYGRKKIILASCLVALLGCILILTAKSVLVLCIGRYFNGLAGGMQVAATMYIAEIADSPKSRGFLLSIASPILGVGITTSFILGSILTVQLYSISICCLLLLIFGLTLSIPESPVWLMQKNDVEGAVKSLKWFHRTSDDIKKCMKKNNIDNFDTNSKELSLITRIMKTKAWKPYLNLTTYFILQGLSGYPILVFYTSNIYQSLNIPVDISLSSIILVIIQTATFIFLSIFFDKLNRRTWNRISAIGLFITFAVITVYEYLFFTAELKPVFWLPLVCIWAASIFGSLGMYTIPWIFIGELFPTSISDCMGSAQLMTAFLINFVSIKTYPLIEPVLQIYGVFIVFTISSFVSILYSQFLMPETRGKTLAEIEKMWLLKY